MPLLTHLAAFESRDFRYIWGANALGGASTWTFLIASQWYVLSESDKSLLVGLFTFASMLPYLLVSPIGGILADRTERKKLTAITQAGITISIVTSVILSLFGVLNLWHLCILAFAAGCFRSTQESALVSLVTNVVPKKTLLNAITLNSATRHGSRVIGMGLLLMTRVPLGEGLDITQFLLASSLLGAISLILIIRVRKRSTGESLPETGLIRGMLEGVKFIYTKHEVGIFIILVAFHCALVMSFDSILPVLTRDSLGSGDEFLLALLVLSFGGGAAIGTFLLAGVRNEAGKGRLLLLTGIVSSVSPIALGLSSDISISFIASFLMGASQSTFMALTITYVQLATPDQYRGRVSSLYILHAGGIMAFANLGYGELADTFTAPIVLVITGGLFLIVFSSIGIWDKVLRKTMAGKYQILNPDPN